MDDGKKWRALVLAGIVAALVIIAFVTPVGSLVDQLAERHIWRGPTGIAMFIGLYILWNCALPPAPLQALAGAYYGITGGLVVIAVSTSLANAISHGLARWLGRDWVAQRVQERPRLAALEKAVEQMGWKGVALLRVSNLIPSNIANLMMGVTALTLPTILWASIVGSLPGWAVMLTLGRSGLALLGGGELNTAEWIAYGLSGVAALGLMVGVGWYARKALQEQAGSAED